MYLFSGLFMINTHAKRIPAKVFIPIKTYGIPATIRGSRLYSGPASLDGLRRNRFLLRAIDLYTSENFLY